MKVAVFGLGYAGPVSAACLTKCAHDVWGLDVDVDGADAGIGR
jgi:UDP-glucose 6-dehydrogenase